MRTVYLISVNKNPMIATFSKGLVEALRLAERAKHFAQVRNRATIAQQEALYDQQFRWTTSEIPFTDSVDTTPPPAPSHNPAPVKPSGVQQVLPGQTQAPRKQLPLTDMPGESAPSGPVPATPPSERSDVIKIPEPIWTQCSCKHSAQSHDVTGKCTICSCLKYDGNSGI